MRPKGSEQIRASLIDVGMEQLSVAGYHGTGIKQILDVLNVPKGSFYNYFNSKEAFVAEVVTEFGQQLIQDLDESISKSQLGALDTLRAIFEDSIHHSETQDCQKGCLVGSLAAELGDQNKLCQQAMLKVASQWEQRITKLLAQGQKAGEIRVDVQAEQLAKVVWCSWQGAMMRMKLERQGEMPREIVRLLLDSILKPNA